MSRKMMLNRCRHIAIFPALLLLAVAPVSGEDLAVPMPSAVKVEGCEKLTAGGFMEAPSLASSNGVAWAVWLSREPGGREQVLSRRYAGSWEPTLPVTPGPGKYESPCVSCLSDGSPVVIWVAIRGDRWILEYSRYSGGKFSKPVPVSSGSGRAANPSLVSAPDGRAWVAWESYQDGMFWVRLSGYSRGSWGEPVAVTSGDSNAYDPAVAVDPVSGRAWIAYSAVDNQFERSVFLVDFDTKTRRFGARVPVAIGGKLRNAPNRNSSPSVDCDREGRVWVAYERDPGKRKSPNAACYQGDRECSVVCYWKGKLWAVSPGSAECGGKDVLTGSEDYLPTLARDGAGRMLLFSRVPRSKDTYPKGEMPRTIYNFRASLLDPPKGWTAPSTLLTGNDLDIGDICRPAAAPAGSDSVWIAWQGDNIKYTGLFAKLDDFRPVESSIWVARVRLADDKVGLGQAKLEETSAGTPTNLKAIKSGAMRGRPAVKRRVVEADGQKYTVIMGNLHEHTNTPSSCMLPSNADGSYFDNYRHAIDMQGYDFEAITDHDFGLYYDAAWRKALRAADFYNTPPHFMTIPAYEFSFINTSWGKQYQPARGSQILYFGSDESAMRFTVQDARPRCQLDPETNDLNKLLGMLHRLNIKDAVLPPHQLTDFYSVTDWSIVDPEYRTVMEIFQVRGSYEYEGCPWQAKVHFTGDGGKADGYDTAWAQNALARGQRMGFIAAADHCSTGIGMTVLMVKDLSRKGIIEALKARRCYATTGDKIFVDFRVNGHLMGQELKVDAPPRLTAEIQATAPIKHVVIFKNNKTLYETDAAQLNGLDHLKLDLVDDSFVENSYYYLRVVQDNDEIAWSSPIWVDKESSAK